VDHVQKGKRGERFPELPLRERREEIKSHVLNPTLGVDIKRR